MNAFLIVVAVWVLLALAFVATLWRASRRPTPPASTHDVGPDALRLLEDLDAHLAQQYARLSDLYERVGSPPANGFTRLMQAIRDEQNKGERP